MRYKEVITLLKSPYTADAIGNQIPGEYERVLVFANLYSISADEYYNAALTGLRPSKAFDIYSFEYSGQDKLEYEGQTYNIVRADTRGERTRLYCEKVAGQ